MRFAELPSLPEGRVRVHRIATTGEYSRTQFSKAGAVNIVYDRKLKRFVPVPARFPVGWLPVSMFRPNKIMYEWGAIVGRQLTQGTLEYKIGGMYIEFENVADPNDPVVAPSFGREEADGVEYYNGLSGSPNRDYLRVPLIAATMNTSDATKFPKGNVPTFFAQTSGVVGVHGKPFSDVNNSKVFGAALVATIDEDDHTQDLVFSRFYMPSNEQQVKLSTSQIGIEWEVKLK